MVQVDCWLDCIVLYFSDANILAFLKEAGLENVQSPKCIEGGSIHERREWVYGDIMSQAIQMLIDETKQLKLYKNIFYLSYCINCINQMVFVCVKFQKLHLLVNRYIDVLYIIC